MYTRSSLMSLSVPALSAVATGMDLTLDAGACAQDIIDSILSEQDYRAEHCPVSSMPISWNEAFGGFHHDAQVRFVEMTTVAR